DACLRTRRLPGAAAAHHALEESPAPRGECPLSHSDKRNLTEFLGRCSTCCCYCESGENDRRGPRWIRRASEESGREGAAIRGIGAGRSTRSSAWHWPS